MEKLNTGMTDIKSKIFLMEETLNRLTGFKDTKTSKTLLAHSCRKTTAS